MRQFLLSWQVWELGPRSEPAPLRTLDEFMINGVQYFPIISEIKII